ncbi:hypothetical protein [Ruminiclostridium papyrosolvens]|uniref:Uncharacterized protein n=1 Tax=Ruminiclostridium papyrosolvens C7 TaxID=1330534 RepID=U4R1B1_9FIRM|nr:hypothetical protein [Ruminiclostridium papyrosolvens]EPR10563.1 hypothetical protein L323_13610 [Ruminiclostridium papyrosolvens C7]
MYGISVVAGCQQASTNWKLKDSASNTSTIVENVKEIVVTVWHKIHSFKYCKGLHNPLQYIILNKTTKGYIIRSEICLKNRKFL